MKNTTKAQRDVELTNQTQREIVKKTKSGGDEIQGGPIRGSFTNQH